MLFEVLINGIICAFLHNHYVAITYYFIIYTVLSIKYCFHCAEKSRKKKKFSFHSLVCVFGIFFLMMCAGALVVALSLIRVIVFCSAFFSSFVQPTNKVYKPFTMTTVIIAIYTTMYVSYKNAKWFQFSFLFHLPWCEIFFICFPFFCCSSQFKSSFFFVLILFSRAMCYMIFFLLSLLISSIIDFTFYSSRIRIGDSFKFCTSILMKSNSHFEIWRWCVRSFLFYFFILRFIY